MSFHVSPDSAGRDFVRLRRWTQRLMSSAARIVPGPARRSQLVLDPLEPRLMLNADVFALDLPSYDPGRQNHDLLVRMVEEVRVVDNQSIAVQRVEIVDRQDPAQRYASAYLDEINEVSIIGGAGDDRIEIDTASFAGFDAPIIRFAGGDGYDQLSLTGPEASDWFIDGQGGGHVSGASRAEFEGVEHLGAGAGTDNLHGSHTDTGWLIDGLGSGSIGAHGFSGFENLIGAAGNHDVFTVTSSGRLAGYVHGNDGGFDTLVLDIGSVAHLTAIATAPDAGSLIYDGSTIAYFGLEPVTINGTTVDMEVIIPKAPLFEGNVAKLSAASTDPAAPRLLLDSINGLFEDTTFNAPTNSLTITAGSGLDDIEIASLPSGFSASLTVNALLDTYDPFSTGGILPGDNFYTARSVIRVTGDISLPGDKLTLTADTIYVGTVVEQTGTSGSFTAGSTTSNVTGAGGSGSGMRAEITVDADGDATARITAAGTGYAKGDTIAFAAGSGTVTVKVVNAANSAVISTQQAGGNAGDILFGFVKDNKTYGGKEIYLGPNAQLLAQADTAAGKKPGKITLATTDIAFRAASWPIDYTQKDTLIVINGAIIKGGAISITAKSTDTNAASSEDVPSYLQGFVGNLTNMLNQIPGAAISAFTGIDVSVVLRGADAKIHIYDATIVSAASVDISASTKVDTQVYAIAMGVKGLAATSGFEFAAGYGLAESTVQVIIGGNTSITAEDNVRITASGETSTKTTARASSNLLTPTVDPNATSIAVAIAHTDLDALARVGAGAAILARNGNVNVTATGKTKQTADASTVGFVDGRAGIGVGLSFDFSDVVAELDGDIVAGGSPAGGAGPKFDGSSGSVVDLASDTIHVPDHGLTNGQVITYTAMDGGLVDNPISGDPLVVTAGTAIGGLKDKSTYYVIVVDADNIRLANAPVLDLDASGTDATSTHTIQVPAAKVFDLNAIDANADTIRIAGHGFETGDQVAYTAGSNGVIAGLANSGVYTVEKVDDLLFKLKDNNGNVIQVSQGAALGSHTFTRGTDSVSLELARADADTDRITLANHGFANNTLVTYSSLADGGIDNIPGLVNETEYRLVVIDADTFELYNVATGLRMDLGASTAGASHGFAYIGTVHDINPTTAVNGNTDTITINNHGLADGQAIIYGTDPTKTRTQTITQPDGQVMNIDIADREIGGLENGGIYYVVKIDANNFRLVEDPLDVKSVKAIDLTSLGNGNYHSLGDDGLTNGIGVKASLVSETRTFVKPEVGGKFNPSKYKDILTRGDIAAATLFGNASASSGKQTVKDQNGKDVTSDIKNDGLSGAGAVGVNVVLHDVRAVVGERATSGDKTKLTTEGDIEVLASIEHKTQLNVQGSVSKPKNSQGAAVSISIGVGVYDNDSQAIIRGNTQLDAFGTVKVDSQLTYPFLTKPEDLLFGIPQDIVNRGVSGITTLLDGTFGVSTKLMNNWVLSYAKATESPAASVSGSIAVNVFTNTSKALIQSGVEINQKAISATWQPATQSVIVNAYTMMQLIEMVGIGKWSLNEGPLGKARYEGKTAAQLRKGGDIVDVAGRSGSKALGGSILVDSIDSTTHARIEGNAKVKIGSSGKLTVTAKEDILRVAIAQSGGQTDDKGTFAFAGSGLGFRQRSDVQAGIVANGSAGPTINGGGAVEMSAMTGGVQVGVAGSMVFGGAGSSGLGLSVMVADVDRDVYAFVGADPNSDPYATPDGAVTMNVGAMTVNATTGGTIVGVVGTAVALTSQGPVPESPDDALDGASLPGLFGEASNVKSGIGIAGSAGVNVINDTTLAYINARGAIATTTLALEAKNDQTLVQITGGVAISKTNGTQGGGGTTVGGSFALNQLNADTRALIVNKLTPTGVNGLTVTASAADGAGDEISLKATRGGTIVTFSAAISANMNTGTANAFAGSVSINRLVDTTQALIDGAAIVAADALMKARNQALVVAIGGGAAYTAGGKGIGASIGFNQLAAQTKAGMFGTARGATATLGDDLTIESVNDQNLTAIAVSAGISTGGGGTGGAFTIGINLVSTDERVFARENAAEILAGIDNATVTASGGVNLTAQDDSAIQAVAGALGIGTQGTGFGAGLGWNQIAMKVRATIDSALVTAGNEGVNLSALSTDQNAVPAGKIAAAAVGAAGSGGVGTAIGVSASVNGILNTIEATVLDNATVTVNGTGSLRLRAEDDSTIRTFTGGVAISTGSGTGVGAAAGANYVANDVTAKIDASTVDVGGEVTVTADEAAVIQTMSLGLGVSTGGSSGAGSLSINVVTNDVTAAIDGVSDVDAADDVRVLARNTSNTVAIAGGIAGSSSLAVGLSGTNVTLVNTTKAFIDGRSTVAADGTGANFTDILDKSRSGVSVEALSDASIVIIAAGGAVSASGGAGAGAITVTFIDDTVQAYIEAPGAGAPVAAGVSSLDDVNIVARGETTLTGVAGTIAGASSVGIGAGVDAGVVKRKVEAFIGNGAKVDGDDNVIVDASGDLDLVSVSASGAFAGTGAGTLTAGVTVLDLTARAYIGSGAIVTSDGNVVVQALDDTTLDQISANISGAGTGAVGLAAGIGVMTKNTEAYIASDAQVTALAMSGKAGIVALTGDLAAPLGFGGNSVSGSVITISGHGLINGDEVLYTSDNPIQGLSNGTRYFVIRVNDNQVRLASSLTNANAGNALTLGPGGGLSASNAHLLRTVDAEKSGGSKDFATSAVNYGTNQITASGHNFTTGEEIVYTAESIGIGGLVSGQRYYVIRHSNNTFGLASSRSEALNGNAVDLTDNGAGTTARHVVQSLTSTGVPDIDNDTFDDTALAASNGRNAAMAVQKGLVVAAVSLNDMTAAGVGVAISGTGSGAIAGTVAVHTVNTRAYIDEGAKINQTNTGAGADQNVRVAATRSYEGLTIGGGLAGSGTFAAAPAVAAPKLAGETLAYIKGRASGNYDTIVNAAGDVAVQAQAEARMISVAAGIAASGGVSIAGSGAVILIDTDTLASISGRVRVTANGDVLVGSRDDTTSYVVAGAVGIGLAGGGGAGAVNVTQIDKLTTAMIGADAIVDANAQSASVIGGVPTGDFTGNGYGLQTIRGVAVLAQSSENIVAVSASIGAGSYVGIAGAVSVELIDSDTVALIGDGAAINMNTAASGNAAQSVTVSARNTVDVLSISGALGASLGGGIGGSFDVGLIRNDTQALIGSAQVRAKDDVDVSALSRWKVDSNAIAAGGGLVGIGGGVVVYTIGGNFSDDYSGDGQNASALSGDNGDTVIGFVEDTVGTMTGLMQTGDQGNTSDPDLPAFNPASAVDATANTINLGVDAGVNTGDSVVYSVNGGTAIGGLEDGKVYFVIVDAAQPNKLKLAATYEDANIGRAIGLTGGATGTNHTLNAASAQVANIARQSSNRNAPSVATELNATGVLASGTTAAIEVGAEIAAGDIDVEARQKLDFTTRAGGVAAGAGALGIGIVVLDLNVDTTAYIAPSVTLTGLNSTSSLSVAANLDSDIRALGFGGAVSGFVSLGGAVAYVTDNSSARALLGAKPGNTSDDTQVAYAGSAAAATKLFGFASVTVDADATIDHYLTNAAASVSGVAGLGAAIVLSDIDGTVQAIVGDYTEIGTTTGVVGNTTGLITSLVIDADRAVTIHPFSAGSPFGIAIGGGAILGVAAGYADVDIGGSVTSRLGARTKVYASGDIDVLATGTVNTNNIDMQGGAIGGIAVGVVIAHVSLTPKVTAVIGSRSTLQARSLDLNATNTNTGRVWGIAAGGGILSGQGLDIVMTAKPETKAEIGEEAVLTTTLGLSVNSTSTSDARAYGDAGNYGGITVIIGTAETVLENTNTVSIGNSAQLISGTSLSLLASSTNTGLAEADGGGGAIVAITQGESKLNMKDTTKAIVGASAKLTAVDDVSVESRASSTGDSRAIGLAQGLGADTEATARMTYGGITNTEIGVNAELRATGNLNVLARVTKLDLDSYAEADADAAGADSDAEAYIDPAAGQRSSDVGVVVRSGAKLTGDAQVNLKARQENLQTHAKADADTDGLGGDTDATAINTFDAATRVNTEASSEISTRALYVEAEAGAHGATADESRSGALIDGGSGTERADVTFPRTIVFNSAVFLYGPANPELEISTSGAIVRRIGIDPVTVTASEVIVPDIIYASTAAGTATFSISTSSLDPNPAGYGTSPAENSIEGNATFKYVTGFDRVTIVNHSTRHLRIGAIEPFNPNPNFVGNLVVNVTETSRFIAPTSSDPGRTRIEIVNTNVGSAPDVRLTKLINNRYGTTLIEAAGGDILTWAHTASIRSTTLELIAGGVIGVNGTAVRTETTLVRAQAGTGIVLSETGDLELDTVRSTSGLIDLTATQSIFDGNASNAANVAGPNIKLTASAGSIGLAAAMLSIDADIAAGSLIANAQTGIAIIDEAGGLGVGTARSTTGDVALQTRDSLAAGENIFIGANGVVQALAGAVNIFAGDDLFLDAAATIAAAGAVALRGDHDNADSGIGARIDLRGRITGTSVTIASGDDGDKIGLRRVILGAPVTIESGGGQDEIRIGSQATPDINAGGTLSTIEDTLIVNAGGDQDTLDLDDTGSAQARTVVATSGAFALSGVGGEIRFSGTDTVKLALGDRNDTVAVRSTAIDMRTEIGTGAGDDTITFGGIDDTLDAIEGLTIVSGGADRNVLRVFDSGDTAPNAGKLGGGNNNQIFGFGMGSADQTSIVETAGITYGDIDDLTIELGSGSDNIVIEGVSTKTTLLAGGGADSVTVAGTLSNIAGDLRIQGDASDTLLIRADTQADLTLSQASAGRGRMTGIGMTGSVEFEGMPNATIRLSDDADKLRIVGTAMPLIVEGRGGDDIIVVDNAAHATTFDLGAGSDTITLLQSSAAVTVTGDGTAGGTDRLIVDRSATTAAYTAARIADGASTGEGVVSGVTAADVTFRDMDRVDVNLGSGNDRITINTTNTVLPDTVIATHTGAGDDIILAESISLAPTIVNGGADEDTLKIVIPGVPDGQQFTALQKTIELLIVDNSQNASAAVDWLLDGVVLKAGATNIVTTEGADVTRILGGQTGTDTLTVRSATPANVTGSINGNAIELRSGLVVVTQADPAEDFDTYRNYDGVMGFDRVTDGAASHVENGFKLSTSNGGGFLRDDEISRSVTARATNDLFTLVSSADNGTPTGNAFALYSIELANTGAADKIVGISGLSITGQPVSQNLLVKAGVGFQRFDIDAVFTALSQVTITPGTDILVDNIVARDVLTNSGAGTQQIVPTYTLEPGGGDIVFNTDSRTITGANILVDNDGVPGADIRIFSGTVFGSSAIYGITATSSGGLTTFTFAGDFIIPDNVTVRATGSNALSIRVGDDVTIGANVTINVSATSQSGAIGGGNGGAAQSGGAGGSGGTQPQGGSNGGGPSTVTRAGAGQGGAAGQGDAGGGSGLTGNTGRGGAQGGGGGGGGAVNYDTFLGAIVSHSTWEGGYGGYGGTGDSGDYGFEGNRGSTGHNNSYANNSDGDGGDRGSYGGGGGGGDGADKGNHNSGTPGTDGTEGGDGFDGSGGANNTTGTGISGGMGGGSGGSGGGGGAGGGGGGGGGGSGAYWTSGLDQYVQGGGGGGGGGSGGRGGTGGTGGAGGAGGGAIEIIAAGRVSIGASTDFLSHGANGSEGTAGLGNQLTGGDGDSGQSSRNSGADGSRGGDGANGGTGGDGAGGSGGTIKIFATDVNASGATVDANGGDGFGNAGDGGDGRFLIGRNTGLTSSDGRPGSITNARIEAFSGTTTGLGEANRYLSGDGWTANIAGLAGGADIFGIIAGLTKSQIDFDSVASGVQQAQSGALLAVMRFEFGIGDANEDYTGYDMLVIVNLTNIGLSGISLGVGEAAQALRVDGLGADGVLGSLPAGAVWATLIPESAQNISVSMGSAGSVITSGTINDGGVQYISATRPALNVAADVGSLDAVAASADGSVIYAVNTAQNAVIAINAADGSQRQLLKQGEDGLSGLNGASAVAVAGNYVLVSSTGSAQISVFERDAKGDLTYKGIGASGGNYYGELRFDAATNTVTASGASGVKQFTLQANGTLSATSTYNSVGSGEAVAKGDQLFVVDRTGDALRVVDMASGQTTQTLSGFLLGLDGASDLALSPDGNTLYVTGRDGNTLSVFAIGSGAQPLTHVQTLKDGIEGVRGLAEPTDVAVTPDGGYVVVTGSAGNAITVFQRNATTGALVYVQTVRHNVSGIDGLGAPTAMTFGPWSAGAASMNVYVASAGANAEVGGLAVFNIDLGLQPEPEAFVTEHEGIESLTVELQGGDDTFSILSAPPAIVTSTTIRTGDGDDRVIVNDFATATVIELGGGNDIADLRSTTANRRLTVYGGDDGDIIYMQSGGSGATTNLYGDAGNDEIVIQSVGASATTEIFGGVGDDVVRIFGANLPVSAITIAHGEDHSSGDRLIFDPGVLGYTSSEAPGAPSFTNGWIEAIGRGRVTYDTFENGAILTAPVVTVSPGSVAEGGSITIEVNVVPNGSAGALKGDVLFDIDGDGRFGEVVGVQVGASTIYRVTLTWEQLVSFGLSDNGTYLIAARATNGDDLTGQGSALITIADTPPLVTVAGTGQGYVGESYRIDFSALDPSPNDRVLSWEVDWGYSVNGVAVIETFGAGTLLAAHVYVNPGSYQIRVRAIDKDVPAGTLSSPHTVNVGVRASQVGINGPYIIAEGEDLSFSGFAPGTPASVTWDIDGDGQYDDAAGLQGTLTWAQLNALGIDDGTTAFNIRMRAAYASGLVQTAVNTVTLLNASPSFTHFLNNGPVDEGATATITVAATDPSAPDAANLSYTFDFDLDNDGTFDVFGQTLTAAGPGQFQVPSSYLRQSGLVAIRGIVSDGDGGTGIAYTSVHVREVAPTLTVSGANGVAEGSPYTLLLSASDPGSDMVSRWIVDWGDGNVVGYDASTGVTSANYVYADDGARTVKVTAIDNDGSYQAADKLISVTNVPPVLSALVTADISEHGITRLTGLMADAGVLDSFILSIDWGDGSAIEVLTFAAGTQVFDVAHRYLQDSGGQPAGVYAIQVTLADDDGGADQDVVSVLVANLDPVMTSLAVNPSSFVEGGQVTVTGSFTDIGTLDTHIVEIVWGDGSTSNAVVDARTRTFVAMHTYNDTVAPNNLADTFTITARVTDERGAADTETATVVMTDAPPEMGTVTLNGVTAVAPNSANGLAPSTITIDEHGVLTVAGVFRDPGLADSHDVTILWGDGATTLAVVTVDATDPTIRHYIASHRYIDDDPTATLQDDYEIVITARDSETGLASSTRATFTVANVDPVVVTVDIDKLVVDENGVVTIVGAISDVGTLDTHRVEVSWGDGTTSIAIVDSAARTFVATHQYLDDNPTGTPVDRHTISVVAIDDDGGRSVAKTTNVDVRNLAPDNLVLKVQSSGQSAIVSGTFTDVGAFDTHTVVIVWGDGAKTRLDADPSTRSFSAAHSYFLLPGQSQAFSIQVIVEDDDTGTVIGKIAVTVSRRPESSNGVPSLASLPPLSNPVLNNVIATTGLPGLGELPGVVLSGSGIPFDKTGSINENNGEGNRLSVNEGAELRLPQAVLDMVGDGGRLTIDWGDGKIETVDRASKDTALAGHVYKDDSGNGSYRLSITVTGDDGTSRAMAFDVTVRNVAPVLSDVTWRVENGEAGARAILSGTIVDPGIDDRHIVLVNWSDGSVTQAMVADDRTFVTSRSYAANGALVPVEVSVVDARDSASVVRLPINGPRASDPIPQKEGAKPQRSGAVSPVVKQAAVTDTAFIGIAAELAFGGAVAGLALRRADRPRQTPLGQAIGAVVLPEREAGSHTFGGTSLRIDALLARRFARLCGDQQAIERLVDLPVDWQTVDAPDQAAGADEDWLLLDGSAAEWMKIAAE